MSIQIFEHLSYRKIIRFTSPTITMLVLSSIYGVVDGFFVSNFVGKTSFAAVNFIIPFLMILSSMGFMFGTGGGALISKTFGEGDLEKAKQLFSSIVYITIVAGIVFCGLGLICIRPFALKFGAEGQLLEDCVSYGSIVLLALPLQLLQYEFQCLASTSGKPVLGLCTTFVSGGTNIFLDGVFLIALGWGIKGVAAATVVSHVLGGMIPLIYFTFPNKSLLQLGKAKMDGKAFAKICYNGASELVNNISMSVVSMLYNIQLLRYASEDGIAIYGVLMYISIIFDNIYMGYSVGIAPIIGYHYGAQNHKALKELLKKSVVIISSSAVLMYIVSLKMAGPLCAVFLGYDKILLNITIHAFSIFRFAFLFSGYPIFGSAFFTALNNGVISMVISGMRTFLFQSASVILFPLIWGVDGIWLSLIIAEAMSAMLTFLLLVLNRKKYHYV